MRQSVWKGPLGGDDIFRTASIACDPRSVDITVSINRVGQLNSIMVIAKDVSVSKRGSKIHSIVLNVRKKESKHYLFMEPCG